MKGATTKILGRGAVLLAVLALVVVAVNVRGDAPGITFATQGVDLKIDSKAFYNGAAYPTSTWSLKDLVPTADHFFNFPDIKPGDYGRTVISIHVAKSSAFLCLDFKNLISKDNGVNEPESPVDPNGNASGELAAGTQFFAWVDNGDNIYQPGEKIIFNVQPASTALNNTTYPIGDSGHGGSCGVNQTKYVGVAWCAGAMTVNPITGAMTCNGGALGNIAQTDSFNVDVGIRTESANENPHFLCSSGSPVLPPPFTPKGKISGQVYNDLNKNLNKNSGEPGLPGWKINLYSGSNWHGSPIQSAITDANGNYSFSNLANGTYSIEEINQSGWTQETGDFASVVISGGGTVTNRDFANIVKKFSSYGSPHH